MVDNIYCQRLVEIEWTSGVWGYWCTIRSHHLATNIQNLLIMWMEVGEYSSSPVSRVLVTCMCGTDTIKKTVDPGLVGVLGCEVDVLPISYLPRLATMTIHLLINRYWVTIGGRYHPG